MDIVLFTVYSHIMMSSGSFTNALSYLYRAQALDPLNPVTLLSIAFCYLHELFKRQVGNRHAFALMGWSWFGKYEEARMRWAEDIDAKAQDRNEKRQVSTKMVNVVRKEVEFNKARCWEMLGMADMAIRGYKRCLDMPAAMPRSKEDIERMLESMRVLWARDSGTRGLIIRVVSWRVGGILVVENDRGIMLWVLRREVLLLEAC